MQLKQVMRSSCIKDEALPHRLSPLQRFRAAGFAVIAANRLKGSMKQIRHLWNFIQNPQLSHAPQLESNLGFLRQATQEKVFPPITPYLNREKTNAIVREWKAMM